MIDSIVIYSQMISDVEQRTYEFAMLRTLGFQKNQLVVLLVLQSILISIPSTFVGFILLGIVGTGT